MAVLTHWGRATHICVSKLTIIASDNGLSPGRRQAIIWFNDGILLIWPLGTNFSEILNEILSFSCKKMHLKMSSGKWRPFCLGLNVLTHLCQDQDGIDNPEHRFSHKWQPRVCKWNFRVCIMPLLMKFPLKIKELGWFYGVQLAAWVAG